MWWEGQGRGGEGERAGIASRRDEYTRTHRVGKRDYIFSRTRAEGGSSKDSTAEELPYFTFKKHDGI